VEVHKCGIVRRSGDNLQKKVLWKVKEYLGRQEREGEFYGGGWMRCTSSGQVTETGAGIYKRAVAKLVCGTKWTVCGLPAAISLLFWLNWAA
jgi:hypothetical protein